MGRSCFFFSSRRRHTISTRDWSSDVCSSDLSDPAAADEFYERTWARPSITVHSVASGDPTLHKTSIQTEARASLSVRLAPGQDAAAMSVLLEQTLRDACPAHAELELEMWPPGEPAWMDPSHPALRVGFD